GFVRLIDALRRTGRVAAPNDETAPYPTVVLPIDQGEELFSEDGRREAQRFLALLRATLEQDDKLLAVVAMRSDAFPLMQDNATLRGLPKATFNLDSMLEGEWSNVIEGPARLVKPKPLEIAPQLTEALLTDVAGQTDALPLLAFTLEQLHAKSAASG